MPRTCQIRRVAESAAVPHPHRAMADLVNAVEQELQGERASALGTAGKRLEAALAALADPADATPVEDKLDEAATAAWHFLIVRESLRFYDHREALELYRVPPQVLARVGVLKRR
jgi:hypothetical protein